MGADVEGFDSCGCALARHVPETIVSTAATTSADFLPMNVSSEKAIELRCDPRWAVHHVAPWTARRQSARCRPLDRRAKAHPRRGRHPLTPNPQYRGEARNFFVASEAHHSQVTCGDINTGYSLRACRRETFPEPGINNLWRRTLSSALYRPRP